MELLLLPPPVLQPLLVDTGLIPLPSTIFMSDITRAGTAEEYVLKDDFAMTEVIAVEFEFLCAVPNLSSDSDLFKTKCMI